jgi:hypothetical protein
MILELISIIVILFVISGLYYFVYVTQTNINYYTKYVHQKVGNHKQSIDDMIKDDDVAEMHKFLPTNLSKIVTTTNTIKTFQPELKVTSTNFDTLKRDVDSAAQNTKGVDIINMRTNVMRMKEIIDNMPSMIKTIRELDQTMTTTRIKDVPGRVSELYKLSNQVKYNKSLIDKSNVGIIANVNVSTLSMNLQTDFDGIKLNLHQADDILKFIQGRFEKDNTIVEKSKADIQHNLQSINTMIVSLTSDVGLFTTQVKSLVDLLKTKNVNDRVQKLKQIVIDIANVEGKIRSINGKMDTDVQRLTDKLQKLKGLKLDDRLSKDMAIQSELVSNKYVLKGDTSQLSKADLSKLLEPYAKNEVLNKKIEQLVVKIKVDELNKKYNITELNKGISSINDLKSNMNTWINSYNNQINQVQSDYNSIKDNTSFETATINSNLCFGDVCISASDF